MNLPVHAVSFGGWLTGEIPLLHPSACVMTIARIVAFILWFLSFLVVWPAAAQARVSLLSSHELSASQVFVDDNSGTKKELSRPEKTIHIANLIINTPPCRSVLRLLRKRSERYIKVTFH